MTLQVPMCIALTFDLESSLMISSQSLIILIDPSAVSSVRGRAVIGTYSWWEIRKWKIGCLLSFCMDRLWPLLSAHCGLVWISTTHRSDFLKQFSSSLNFKREMKWLVSLMVEVHKGSNSSLFRFQTMTFVTCHTFLPLSLSASCLLVCSSNKSKKVR